MLKQNLYLHKARFFAGKPVNFYRPLILILSLLFLLVLTRWILPDYSLDYVGPRLVLDEGIAVFLLGITVIISGSLGFKVLNWMRVGGLSAVDQLIYAHAIGFGILAYGILGLSLAGWLTPWSVLAWLCMAALLAWKEICHLIDKLPSYWTRLRIIWVDNWGKNTVTVKAIWISIGIILFLSFLEALTPPWDYDGLMYHLQGAKIILEAGRMQIMPDMLQANSPFTVEMLFILGLVFKSDVFAKLIHFYYAILFTILAFSLAKRYLGNQGGLLALYILLGSFVYSFLPSWIQVDFAWALYEMLAFYAFLLWIEGNKEESHLLILMGLMGGISLGIKYLAIASVGLLGAFIFFSTLRKGLKFSLYSCAIFAMISLIVGSPWYLKNWILAGNPVYPMYMGGLEWPIDRVSILSAHMQSFGTGHGFWDYLLLPWYLFVEPQKFTPLSPPLERLPLFSFLALLFPFSRYSKKINILAVWVIFRFIIWALSYQVARHLLPIFPALSIMAAAVLLAVLRRMNFRRTAIMAVHLLVFLGVGISAVNLIKVTIQSKGILILLGMESKQEFLQGGLPNYNTIKYIREHLRENDRVLMMWDGRGYYCDHRCLPSADQSKWTWLATSYPNPKLLSAKLRDQGITYLMFSLNDALYFVGQDPSGKQKQALDFFHDTFIPECTKEIYRDPTLKYDLYIIYELTCPS